MSQTRAPAPADIHAKVAAPGTLVIAIVMLSPALLK